MHESISEETAARVWEELIQVQPDEGSQYLEQMKQEQFAIMIYLLTVKDRPFNQTEREVIFYLGMVMWRMMTESPRDLLEVSPEMLHQAEAANVEMMSYLATDTEADFVSATQRMVETYPEPAVLGYLLDALEEDTEELGIPPIRDEYAGLAFFLLKTVLDALINSLAS